MISFSTATADAPRATDTHLATSDLLLTRIVIGDIELDSERRTLKKAGKLIHLTLKEFEITYQLMLHAGRPIRHDRLLRAVWGQRYGNRSEYLRTFMHSLRKKLESDPANPEYILTNVQFGYRFAEECGQALFGQE